jgi:hypothetical protein
MMTITNAAYHNPGFLATITDFEIGQEIANHNLVMNTITDLINSAKSAEVAFEKARSRADEALEEASITFKETITAHDRWVKSARKGHLEKSTRLATESADAVTYHTLAKARVQECDRLMAEKANEFFEAVVALKSFVLEVANKATITAMNRRDQGFLVFSLLVEAQRAMENSTGAWYNPVGYITGLPEGLDL